MKKLIVTLTLVFGFQATHAAVNSQKRISFESSVSMSPNLSPIEVRSLIEKGDQKALSFIAKKVFPQSRWEDHPEYLELAIALINKSNGETLEIVAVHLITQAHWKDHPDLLDVLFQNCDEKEDFDNSYYVIASSIVQDYKPKNEVSRLAFVEFLKSVIKYGHLSTELIGYIVEYYSWHFSPNSPDLLEALTSKAIDEGWSWVFSSMVEQWLNYEPEWKNISTKWINIFIQYGDSETYGEIIEVIFSNPEWDLHPELVEAVIEQTYDQGNLESLFDALSMPHWKAHPKHSHLLKILGEKISSHPQSLIIATEKGFTKLVRSIIDKGVDLNMMDNWGYTALSLAAQEGHIEIVKLLIAKGADLSLTGKENLTPLEWATGRGHTEIVKLLKEAGAKK